MKLLEKCSRSSQALKQVQDKLEKVLYKKEQNNLALNKKPESSETADVWILYVLLSCFNLVLEGIQDALNHCICNFLIW